MKKRNIFFALLVSVIAGYQFTSVSFAQNIGINPNGIPANASAALDVDYTNKGVLIPRISLTQTTSNSPIGAGVANSLLVYNTATVNDVIPGYYYWDAVLSKWTPIVTSVSGCSGCTTAGWSLVGVVNSTIATNSGYIASTYTLTAGKEVLAVAFTTTATEVTVSTANSVGIIEFEGGMFNTNSPDGAAMVMLDSPFFVGTATYTSTLGNSSALISLHILGRTTNANNTPAGLVSSNSGASPFLTFRIGLSGNGTLWLYDADASNDFSMYIFER